MSDAIVSQIEERANQVLAARPQAIPTSVNAPLSIEYKGKAHTLPAAADDLTQEQGLAVYQRMENEPAMASSDFILRALTLSPGWALGTSVEEPGKDAEPEEVKAYAQAEDVRLYVERALNRLETPLSGVMDAALSAWGNGHKLFEQVRAVVKDDDGSSAVQTVAIKPKPYDAYRLVVTRNMDLLGAIPGNGLSLYVGLPGEEPPRFVPSEDLFVFTLRGENGDPRGKAAKRACYDAWNRKQRTKPESLRHAALFGSGRLSLEGPAPTANVTTEPKVTVGGVNYGLVDWLSIQAPAIANGSFVILPDGWQLKVHNPTGNGEAFERAFDRCDREMVMAFLTVTRATLEAEHGSKADSETAMGMLTFLVNYLRDHLCEQVRTQILRPLVAFKYGEDVARLYCPKLLMATAEQEDVPSLLAAIAQARGQEGGVITDEQMPYWDRKLGQPERDLDETEGSDEEADQEQDDTQAFSGPTFKAGSTLPSRLFTRAVRKGNKQLDRISDKLKAELDRIDADTTLSLEQKQDARSDAFDVWEDSAFGTISDVHEKAALAGAKQAGQTTLLTKAQKDRLAEILSEQSEFLADFRDSYEDSVRTDAEAKAQLRTYALRARGTANDMFVEASPEDAKYTWVDPPGTDNHCPDCPRMAADSPYTKETLYTTPGSHALTCVSGCHCYLVRSDGVQGFKRP
jgi:hypothetical protein